MKRDQKSVEVYLLIIIILFGFSLLLLTLDYGRDWSTNTINDDKTPLKLSVIDITSDAIIQDQVYTEDVYVKNCNVTFINCNWTEASGYQLYIQAVTAPATVTLEECNVYGIFNDNGSGIIRNSNIPGYLALRDNASIDMEYSSCGMLATYSDILNPVISIRNSTLDIFSLNDLHDQDAQASIIDSVFTAGGNIEVGGTSSLFIENLSGDIDFRIYVNSTVTLENCNFTDGFVEITANTTFAANNCRFHDISLYDGNISITNSEFVQPYLMFECMFNETLELYSLSPNVVLSNFKLSSPIPGEITSFSVRSGGKLNISNVRQVLIPKFTLSIREGGVLYAQNCDIYLAYNHDGLNYARWENCTFFKAVMQGNNSVFTGCTFYYTVDIDTNPYPYGGSNEPCTIENSEFVDTVIHVISGGMNINNCNFSTEIGLVWLDKALYYYENESDTFAYINNSNPKVIKANLNTKLVAENLICDTIRMDDTSTGIFNNVTVGLLEVENSANVTIDNCHITNYNFQSPHIQITNSIVDGMAPMPDPIFSPLQNSSDFLLNWISQPGQNLTGNIVSYRVFRADKLVGSGTPSPSEFDLIHTILTPNPTLPSDTQYNDTDLIFPSPLDGRALYYMVEIKDAGNNMGNSTFISTVYDTGLALDVLDAQVLFNDLLTTYDNITVSVFMIDADIDDNGTSDCGDAKVSCIFEYTNGTSSSQELTPLNTSIPGIAYYFEIPQTLNTTDLYFSVLVQQNSTFDIYGVGAFDFNSTTKFGALFHIEGPTIAFSPVSHPADNNILESEEIKVSVNVLKHVEYISCVQIHYCFDGGSWITVNMTYDPLDVEYSIILPPFQLGILEYYITYTDVGGQEFNLLRSESAPETKNIIPTFPINQLTLDDLVGIFIGSVFVGIAFSLIYVSFDRGSKKKERLKRKQHLKSILNSPDKFPDNKPKNNKEAK